MTHKNKQIPMLQIEAQCEKLWENKLNKHT